MVTKEIKVKAFADAEFGPTTLLVQTAGKYTSRITVSLDGRTVNAKSLMGMLTLAITEGDLITISAEGEDAEQAVEEIAAVFGR